MSRTDRKGAITMTENEAIKYIQRDVHFIDQMIEHDKGFDPKADINRYLNSKTAYETAISALEEIQQYRDIGTVEECREAVEKQKPKKPKLNYKPRFLGKATYTCPKCGNCCLEKFANERQNNNYCWDCGQAIQWDNLEGTEDENT
jgi:hypothetical protein